MAGGAINRHLLNFFISTSQETRTLFHCVGGLLGVGVYNTGYQILHG